MSMRTFVLACSLVVVASLGSAQTNSPCSARKTRLLYPNDGATNVGVITSPRKAAALFAWSPVRNAASYDVYAGFAGATPVLVDHVVDVEYSVQRVLVGDGEWYVVTNYDGGCPSTTSDHAQFNVAPQCLTPPRTAAAVVHTLTTGEVYHVRWKPVLTSTHYELQESTSTSFAGATTYPVDGASMQLEHDVTQPTAFYYRVRAVAACDGSAGPYSATVRTVIAPKPDQTDPRPEMTIQAGSKRGLVHRIFIPGRGGKSDTFAVTADKPWLTITPASGPLPANGVVVVVTTDPTQIDNGSHTVTLSITTSTPATAGSARGDAAAVVTVPLSVNAVTAVNPAPKAAPVLSTIVLPSVSHADGVNSKWQSDVRLSNPSSQPQSYLLTFTPANTDTSTTEVHTTTMDVDPGDTAALDDIITEWFGFGALGDGSSGALTITAIDSGGKAMSVSPRNVMVASSRTYDVTPAGTLGQYIPPIPFFQFAAAGSRLSLQQIAQSAAFRTNIGLVEGAGQPATATLSVFNNAGAKVGSVDVPLAAGEQKQINSFLAANGVSLTDGRIEVSVSGGGKVAAYASVVDNGTQDPLVVTGVDPSKVSAKSYSVPGVADLNNGALHWRTDMRIFNPGTAKVDGTLTFTPSGHLPPPVPTSIPLSIPAGQVVALDDVLHSKFAQTNIGGAIQFKPGVESPLVVSARTFDQDVAGTYGQFVPAVTAADGVGRGDLPLQLLQVEESDNFRTNVGITEVTGSPATVEISAVVPEAKVSGVITADLGPNEFIQYNSIMKSLGYPIAYNVRVSIKVIAGTGRVAGYASVIDNRTADPTYVPAQ